MANYYASARSNYFRVSSRMRFEQELPDGVGVWGRQDDDRIAIYSDNPDSGSWPCWSIDEHGNETEIDIVDYVAGHLADKEVAVFMESGAEKLRYITGFATAVNNKKERVDIALHDIYEKAKDLGENITMAEF